MADNFDEALGTLCETIVAIEKPNYQSELQPFEAYATTLSHQIRKTVSAYKESLTKGYHLVLDHIKKTNPSELEKYKISNKIDGILSGKENLMEVLERKKILQIVFGYTGKMMKEIYIFADELIQNKNFQEAENVFFYLISLNPYICWFWQGLGKTMQEQGKMDEAVHSYLVSINCDPLRIQGYSDAIRCSLVFKNFDLAYQVIDYGRDVANSQQSETLKKGLDTVTAYVNKTKEEEHAQRK